jgi:hypothetical protein
MCASRLRAVILQLCENPTPVHVSGCISHALKHIRHLYQDLTSAGVSRISQWFDAMVAQMYFVHFSILLCTVCFVVPLAPSKLPVWLASEGLPSKP